MRLHEKYQGDRKVKVVRFASMRYGHISEIKLKDGETIGEALVDDLTQRRSVTEGLHILFLGTRYRDAWTYTS